MKKTLFLICILFCIASINAVPSYEMLFSGSANVPTVKLTNTSTLEQITEFTLTIGNTGYNFDALYQVVHNVGGYTLLSPDSNSGGGARSNVDHVTFTGFDPNEYFQFGTDIDIDNSDTGEDYRTVMFNNGSNPNAVLTVKFSNGETLTQTLPDAPASNTTFLLTQVSPVPEPTTVFLLSLSLLGIAFFRKK